MAGRIGNVLPCVDVTKSKKLKCGRYLWKFVQLIRRHSRGSSFGGLTKFHFIHVFRFDCQIRFRVNLGKVANWFAKHKRKEREELAIIVKDGTMLANSREKESNGED